MLARPLLGFCRTVSIEGLMDRSRPFSSSPSASLSPPPRCRAQFTLRTSPSTSVPTSGLNHSPSFLLPPSLCSALCIPCESFVHAMKTLMNNQSKKEMENFIQAKFEDYNPGRDSQKAPRTVLLIRSQDAVHISFLRPRTVHQSDALLTVYTIWI